MSWRWLVLVDVLSQISSRGTKTSRVKSIVIMKEIITLSSK